MYFTDTPSLGSVEAIMKRPPGVSQRGGGRNRSPYRYTKDDCDCRLCLHYRKKNGCIQEFDSHQQNVKNIFFMWL